MEMNKKVKLQEKLLKIFLCFAFGQPSAFDILLIIGVQIAVYKTYTVGHEGPAEVKTEHRLVIGVCGFFGNYPKPRR